jgi:hypothetical protein
MAAVATRHPPIARVAGAAVLILAAIGMASVALLLNAQYGHSLGDSPLTASTFAGMAALIDVLALALPPAAVGLWRTKQWGLATAAWVAAGVAIAIATMATVGFLNRHLGDTAATRAATLSLATATQDQRAAVIETAKLAVAIARSSRESECASGRGARCLAKEDAERSALNTLQAAVASPLVSPPPIADVDPQLSAVARLAAWIGLRLQPDDFANTRLALWSLILNSGGLVLAIAFGLARSRGSA